MILCCILSHQEDTSSILFMDEARDENWKNRFDLVTDVLHGDHNHLEPQIQEF